MNIADKHNFGKSVEKIRQASGTLFRKPRTVFWEWLFFGNKSPLAEIFNTAGLNGELPLSSFLFNLELNVDGPWLGHSTEVQADESGNLKPSHFYGFGVLLAYSYIFGIRDLHQQNLVKTSTHFQAVDAEIVFTRLVLPSETLLLPFKNFGYEFSGIGALAKTAAGFNTENIQQIFAGYFDLFLHAVNRRDEITHALGGIDAGDHPCRVIVRNTLEYKPFLDSRDLGADLLVSESIQLARGDVPYYFKYLGRKELRWLSTPSIEGVEENLGRFLPDIERHAVDPVALVATNLSSDRKMVHGGIQLIRHFAEHTYFSFKLNGDINIQSNNSQLWIQNILYAAK
jgi:hypothetical protein